MLMKPYRLCRLVGHIWVAVSFNEAAQIATLRCSRCNPDGDGHKDGEKMVLYREG